MSGKNSGFAADLAAGIDLTTEAAPRRSGIAANVLTGRNNRIAELASAPSSLARTSWSILRGAGCGRATIASMRC